MPSTFNCSHVKFHVPCPLGSGLSDEHFVKASPHQPSRRLDSFLHNRDITRVVRVPQSEAFLILERVTPTAFTTSFALAFSDTGVSASYTSTHWTTSHAHVSTTIEKYEGVPVYILEHGICWQLNLNFLFAFLIHWFPKTVNNWSHALPMNVSCQNIHVFSQINCYLFERM